MDFERITGYGFVLSRGLLLPDCRVLSYQSSRNKAIAKRVRTKLW